jgi:hypothetical protein
VVCASRGPGKAAQCRESKPDGIFSGHWPDCELAALLKESKGKKG